MEGDRRRRRRTLPKTYTRWLRCTLIANGVNLPIDRDDAETVACFLVSTGRAVPPARWVDHFIDAAAEATLEGLF